MDKDEEKVIDQNTEPAVEDEVVQNPEEETLAQTDEVLPAPEEPVSPEIPVDTIPATSNPLTVEEPVEAPAEEPVEMPVLEPEFSPAEVPAPETVAEPIPEEPVAEPIPEEPVQVEEPEPVDVTSEEPVSNDVVPGEGDETPVDVVEAPAEECPNCEGEGCSQCGQPRDLTIGQIFGTFQESVTIIWQYHLKTRKHHVHVTLNEFYEKALDIVDEIIEQYQGIHGIVEDTYLNCVGSDGITEVEYLNELKSFINNNKFTLGTDSEIASTVDDLLGLIDTTLYKLTAFTEHAVKTYEEFIYEDYVNEGCGCSKDDEEDAGEEDDEEEEDPDEE